MTTMFGIVFVGLICISSGCFNAKKQGAINLPDRGMFQFGEHEAFIQLPDHYSADKAYPLILFFHGRGADARQILLDDFKLFLSKARQRGYILVAPSCGSDSWMNIQAETLSVHLLKFLNSHLSLDQNKLYVMGMSMGGGAALTFTAHHSKKVSAVCDLIGVTDFIRFYKEGNYNQSIAGAFGGNPDQCPQMYRQRSAVYNIKRLKTVPTLIIHGDQDRVVPLWNSQIIYDKLKSANAKVELIIVPGMGHETKIISGQEDRILDFFENAGAAKNF